MMKCVSQPLGVVEFGLVLSKPYPKSIPNNPNAGIKIRTPAPVERFELKGSNSLKLLFFQLFFTRQSDLNLRLT